MADYVVDTHALYWFLTGSPQLGSAAQHIMLNAAANQDRLLVPSIVIAELYYLNLKLKQALDFVRTVNALMAAPEFHFVDFTVGDNLLFDAVAAIHEMHDRIVAGVALTRGIPVLTRDQTIVRSGLVHTIW